MDIALCISVLVAGAGVFYAMKKIEDSTSVDIESVMDLDVHDDGIDHVVEILKKYKAIREHGQIIESMTLISYHLKHREANLEKLIPAKEVDVVEFGRMYIDRFTDLSSPLVCFLAGIIEKEMDSVRIGSRIPVQQYAELRKIVDVFYYKLQKNTS
jgi:hypothetical protein